MKAKLMAELCLFTMVALIPLAAIGGWTCGWDFHVANLAEGGCEDLPDHPCPEGQCSGTIQPFDKIYSSDDVWIAEESNPGFARNDSDAEGVCWTSRTCGKPAGVRYFKCENEDCVDYRGQGAHAFDYCSEVTMGGVSSTDPYTSAIWISPVVCGE